jgi:hypothetical protein
MTAEVGVTPAAQPRQFYIPEAAAKNLESVTMPEVGNVTGFTTAKGSTYTVDGEGRTLRNKAARTDLGHEGDEGVKPLSTKTVYMSLDEANKIAPPSGKWRLLDDGSGKLSISLWNDKAQKWGIPLDATQKAAYETVPKVGLHPVELWDSTKLPYETTQFKTVHFGNKITALENAPAEPIFHTDVKNNVTVVPSKTGGEGMVPVTVHPDGTIRFGKTETGDRYYLPAAAIKQMKAVRKFGKAPEYKATTTKDGEKIIYLDRKNGVFVQASKSPEGGGMPVSISSKGDIEFLMSGPMKDAQKAIADTSKAVAAKDLKPDEILSQVGDVDKASSVKAAKLVAEPTAENFLDTIPSGMNPKNFFGKGTALVNSFTNKMINKFTLDTQKIFDTAGKLWVNRLTAEATQVGIKEAQDALKAMYAGRVNDGWIDFLHIPPELNPNKANLDTIIARFGDTKGRAFESRAAAELHMREVYKFSPDEATIGQQGNSFFIQAQRFIDETSDAVRQANITPKNTTPVSMFNMLFNRLRTSEDLLSELSRGNRHIATHAPQVLNKLLREQIDSTARGLTKAERRNVETILRFNRDELNPSLGPNKRGNFYRTDGDFEQAYLSRFNKLPSDAETAHYFNYTRISDIDYQLRNLAMYRDKGRIGLEQFGFSFRNSKGDVVDMPWFEGKAADKFPWGGQNAGILIHDSQGETRFLYKHGKDGQLDQTAKKTIEDLVNERGFKVVQLFNPTVRPFSDVDFLNGKIGEQIHFVVTDTSKRKPINFQQLEYRPGGHSIYLDDWYVKQPQLMIGQAGRLHYYGDNAVMNFATEAEAKKYAERMDIARVMYKNNDPRLDSFLASNVPYSVDDFKKMFLKGHLDLETPIVHAKSGTSTFDTVTGLKPEYRDMVDATKSEYNLAGSIDSAFTAERNLTLDTVQERNGFMAIAPGRQLDPYDAMNQALGQAVRNLWMNDYKVQAVQSWIEEFGDVMKPRFKELSNNPMFFLYNPQWNEATVDKARLAAAKASQRAIVNFVGARSELGGQVSYLQNKLADMVYEKFGQSKAQFFADHMLPAITDPASYVRAVAFHSKLGLFNPIQLFVQMQSMANILAISPTHAVPGSAAAFMMRRLAHTADAGVIDHFADIATHMGWQKDQFLEMYDIFRKTGLYEVAGEAALRDDVFDPKLFRSTIGAWLDKGTFFFNEGERAVRMTAFATSYREFKAANPAVTIGNREIGDILNRSDTLSANMTRASAASWQNGILSIPTQFTAYNARIAELFLGKRLTTREKAQAFGMYSALYGVPTAAAATVGVWPFYDDIKEAAMKRGIDLSPAYMQGITEGIPSMVFSQVTGKEYNFAQRYGPGGTTVIRDAIRGDKTMMETLGGPSASILGDIWSSTEPMVRSVAALVRGQSEDFPVRQEDLLAVVNNSSTASLATRIATALWYGKYISKNNVQVGDMDGMDAVMSILGVTPMHITDTYIMAKAGKEDQEVKKDWEKAALAEYAKGMSALKRDDYDGFHAFMARFNTYMTNENFTIEDRNRIQEKAMEYKPDLEEKVREDFYRRAPNSQRDQRFNQMQNFFINKDAK